MEHPRKFERNNSNFQNQESDASLEKAKAPTMKNDGEKKGSGDQNQPSFEAAAEMQQLQDDIELQDICAAFNRLQLRDLEQIFQRTQFPNVFERKELGTQVNGEAEGEPREPEEASA